MKNTAILGELLLVVSLGWLKYMRRGFMGRLRGKKLDLDGDQLLLARTPFAQCSFPLQYFVWECSVVDHLVFLRPQEACLGFALRT